MSKKHHPHIDAAIATASTHLGTLAGELEDVDETTLPEATASALKAFKAQLAEFGKAKPKEAAPAPRPADAPKKAEK
jgi:hypothetical protein